MGDMIPHLITEFDTVILDCPPSGPISDVQIFAGLGDCFLMVVRCGKTNLWIFKDCFQEFGSMLILLLEQ